MVAGWSVGYPSDHNLNPTVAHAVRAIADYDPVARVRRTWGSKVSGMSSVQNTSLAELGRLCQEETARFSRREPTDDRYCFELLRRALRHRVDDAFSLVFRTYQPQVLAWVQRDSRFPRTGESAEYFVNQALSNFYFAVRGEKFDRFPTLQNVLSYLKVTTYSAITQFLRDHLPVASEQEDGMAQVGATDPALEQRLDAHALWEHICQLIPDERLRHLAHCVFVQEMRPREVVRAFPSLWRNEREVTVALYRVRVTLRSDSDLKGWN